jgi:hypothetical protein
MEHILNVFWVVFGRVLEYKAVGTVKIGVFEASPNRCSKYGWRNLHLKLWTSLSGCVEFTLSSNGELSTSANIGHMCLRS